MTLLNTPVYLPLGQIHAADWLSCLNSEQVRRHLVDHPDFDMDSVSHWLEKKQRIDRLPGCRVRAVTLGGKLAGWCAIQPDGDAFEMALVLTADYWGTGLRVFTDMMVWAQALGHARIRLQLLETRPVYRFLTRKALRVYHSERMGRRFTTYELRVTGHDGAGHRPGERQ